jgi:hypothetical protein
LFPDLESKIDKVLCSFAKRNAPQGVWCKSSAFRHVMSQKAYNKTKELFLKKLGVEADKSRERVSKYSRRQRAELLKLARETLQSQKP